MRTAGYAVHQALTVDAATIVKQALTLAKRRGHSQVTPLHVATAMLVSPTGLLRTACLRSHSHPLQCKALELCLNVALNRLPTSPTSPILGPLSLLPSLSNALVAAFKRAQAHQRRGSLENQQQPILALKVELEQLVISILDDPSVSRVMREAGFSSPQVKTNVEQAVSVETSSKSPSKAPKMEITKIPLGDVASVLESLMKKRNTIIVRECLASAESLVKGVIDKFERGDVPFEFRNVQFISLPIFTMKNISLVEAEQKVKELRWLVKSSVGRGVVLYLGDVKWVAEFWSSNGGQIRNFHCPVELMIMEISRLVSSTSGENLKLWLMGIATSQMYMKCKGGNPSLDTLWKLHPLTIHVGNLGLSLNLDHGDLPTQHSQFKASRDEFRLSQIKIKAEKYLTCCVDCLDNFNKEAKSDFEQYYESATTSTNLSLPLWLQKPMEENQRKPSNDQEFDKIRELCKKWNYICNSIHKRSHLLEKTLAFSPTSSPSASTNENHIPNLHPTLLNWPVIFEPKQSPKEHQFFILKDNAHEKSMSCLEKNILERIEPKPDLLSNPNSSPNSASSSEIDENVDYMDRLKEFNSESLELLTKALEKKVPWQKEIIPDMTKAILECRGGISKRRGKSILKEAKEETWLLFLGTDLEGKEKVAKELAKILFGSYDDFVTIGLSNFSSPIADSSEETSKKRSREELGSSYFQRLVKAMDENPNRVFLMEDVEQIDYFSQKGIKKLIESGEILLNGEVVPLKKAIVIFSCESFSSMSRACSPRMKHKSNEENEAVDQESEEEKEKEKEQMSVSLDLNIASKDEVGDENFASKNGILDLVDKVISFKNQVM